jgi:hypothetical protein
MGIDLSGFRDADFTVVDADGVRRARDALAGALNRRRS